MDNMEVSARVSEEMNGHLLESTTLSGESTSSAQGGGGAPSAGDYLATMRPFWWLYLTLLTFLALTIFYLKRQVIMERCRKKESRERVSRLDISSFLGEVMVHHPPPPSYDQAMGLPPQPPTAPEPPPKHPPEVDNRYAQNAFNVWFA